MAELRVDFKSDLFAIVRQQLVAEWGAEAQHISDEVVLISFFDSLRRRPAIRPRTLRVSEVARKSDPTSQNRDMEYPAPSKIFRDRSSNRREWTVC